ncbi:MAG: hypothetical protein HYZ15_16135 [Sphingobacteriales bacterium]|nr:hypothetical protein [Sphingobacteriales bacterium]
MVFSYKGWRSVFLFCFGLSLGAAFCMKWMETDFRINDSVFSIIGLEISYDKARVIEIFSQLDEKVKTILSYHLYFDFAFMTGVYTGIASLCMMARYRVSNRFVRQLLLVLAILQGLAFGCDVRENLYLLSWLSEPVIGDEFGLYHTIVLLKWTLALAGVFLSVPLQFRKKAGGNEKTVF